MARLFGGEDPYAEATRNLEEFSNAVQKATRSLGGVGRGGSGSGSGTGAGGAGGSRFGATARGALAGGLLAAGAFAVRTARTASLRGEGFANQAKADVARLGARFDPTLQNKVEPIDRAADRVAAITENIARFGGKVSDEQRERMFNMYQRQESRVQEERNAVARLANKGVAEAGSGSFGTGEVQKLIELVQNIQDKIASLI